MLDSNIIDLDLEKIFSPLKKYKKIALAVSGGADSLALMILTAKWAKSQKKPPQIFVFSLNHNLRPDSQKEVDYVIGQANRLGLKGVALSWQGKKPKSSIQAKARKARYQIFRREMQKNNIEILLTGHHSHDQMETILMRMAHGSGVSGLIGMKKFTQLEGVNIFRPLLNISPLILKNILARENIKPICDPSNENEDFERVRWRKLLPSLFEMGLGDRQFSLFAKRLKRADDAIEEISSKYLNIVVSIDNFGVLRCENEKFFNFPDEIQIRILQKIIRFIGNEAKSFALADFEKLSKILQKNETIKKRTFHKCVIEKTNKHIIIYKEHKFLPKSVVKLEVGERIIWDNRFEIENIYLRESLTISSATNIKRKELKNLFAIKNIPMNYIQSAPLIMNEAGEMLALGNNVIGLRKKLKINILTP